MPLLDLFFVRKCFLCGRIIRNGAVCDKCESGLKSKMSKVESFIHVEGKTIKVVSLFKYNDELVKKLLYVVKRSGNSDLFKFVASFYLEAAGDYKGTVTNVPRRVVNRRKYGYDQVEVPAKYMCKSCSGLNYKKLLVRRGFSKDQKSLKAEERKKNAEGKFVIRKKDIPKNILLMDDVITTSSTVSACAKKILENRSDAEIRIIALAMSL